jgi:hypothetical protein
VLVDGVQFLAVAEIISARYFVLTGSGTHPIPCPLDTRVPFSKGKFSRA